MLHFGNDYNVGMHPEILRRLVETNFEKLPGYGTDKYCASAAEKIRRFCDCPDAEVHFLLGGTQTNQIVIDTMLKSNEGVVAAETGHINVHEAGAIEYTGHKILVTPSKDGKIIPSELKNFMEKFYSDESWQYAVIPGMVYVSQPTEYGTLYTKRELTEIAEICREYNLMLYLDGARLGYALMSEESDLALPDIARLCDVFYLGGNKVGAICGEALVFTKNNAPEHFKSLIKQHGALLEKGRLLGLQFDTLLDNDLYFKISKNAILMADKLKTIFKEKGYRFYLETPTNMQFLILENEQLVRLRESVVVTAWRKYDETHTVVRFATSWATTDEEIDQLAQIL